MRGGGRITLSKCKEGSEGARAKYRRVREVVATPASHEEAIRLAFLFGQLSFVFCV